MSRIEDRDEPCTRCGGDVELVWAESRGLRPGRRLASAPQPPAARHAGVLTMGDRVDDECTRGQHGPTADYGDG